MSDLWLSDRCCLSGSAAEVAEQNRLLHNQLDAVTLQAMRVQQQQAVRLSLFVSVRVSFWMCLSALQIVSWPSFCILTVTVCVFIFVKSLGHAAAPTSDADRSQEELRQLVPLCFY